MVQPALHGWVQGVKRLVHMSHLNARAKPEQAWLPGGSRWLATKHQGELAVRAEFPEATIFRPSDVYGQVLCHTSQHCLFLTAVIIAVKYLVLFGFCHSLFGKVGMS